MTKSDKGKLSLKCCLFFIIYETILFIKWKFIFSGKSGSEGRHFGI